MEFALSDLFFLLGVGGGDDCKVADTGTNTTQLSDFRLSESLGFCSKRIRFFCGELLKKQ